MKAILNPATLSALTLCLTGALINSANAQISPAADGTGTVINQVGNTTNITGGTQAGSNLFQSFQKFGINEGQTANFVSNPSVQNILGRVTGGDPSVIKGLIQVTGGTSNLYLMNPAGIVFGANASLNVPGSFVATTANGIGFRPGPNGIPSQWFNAVGSNNYAALVGTPTSFAFTMQQPGAIANAGNLSVGQGKSLVLLGGAVLNTGTLSGGTVSVTEVPGEKLVRVGQAGSLITLELPLQVKNAVNPIPFTPPTLPQLLTGGTASNATSVTVNNGTVTLTGSGVSASGQP